LQEVFFNKQNWLYKSIWRHFKI